MPAEPLFAKVPPELDFPRDEREILAFWKERDDLREDARPSPLPNGTFVFYEGPPTANGLPHNGHVLTRVIKDLFPRYKTMRGYDVAAQGGLGHARPARRGRGREGAPHPRQGGDRGVRRRALHQEVHRLGLPLHGGVGGPDRARRLLGRPRRRVRHLPQELRRERVVGARRALQEGPPLPGPQGRLVVGAGRHRAQRRRGRAGLQDGRRPERLRRVPARRRAGRPRSSSGRRRRGRCRRTCTRR